MAQTFYLNGNPNATALQQNIVFGVEVLDRTLRSNRQRLEYCDSSFVIGDSISQSSLARDPHQPPRLEGIRE